ncbi:MAG TPA: 3-dehydroquinate synthase [Sphingomicrobium sp.]|nr:3-dehydroquinate synthase [Sphingomicrobium sp.]
MSKDIRRIEVRAPSRSYAVEIGPGLLDDGKRLARFGTNGRLIIVADRNVWGIHGNTLAAALERQSVKAIPLLITQGERAKSWRTLERLTDALLALNVERGEPIVAFGGGVTGDLVGFAAAILKRGCPFIQVPTSLLAQVDSSVGGKTGINTRAGKNLLGAFHQPSAVLIDTNFLTTLPMRHRRNGWAEVVKYGLIGDPEFFAWCERHGSNVLHGDEQAVLHAISTGVTMKAQIVASDEKERQGIRVLLNLGHTFGHALETATGYSNRVLHGEAVAIGMVLAFELSAELGHCRHEEAARVRDHLRAMRLPTSLYDAGIRASGAKLVDFMLEDKKIEGGTLPFILARGIGEAFVEQQLPLERVQRFLESKLSASGGQKKLGAADSGKTPPHPGTLRTRSEVRQRG